MVNMGKKPLLSLSKRSAAFLLILSIFFVVIGGLLIPVGFQNRQDAINALNGQLNPFSVNTSKPFDLMLSSGTAFQFNISDLASGVDLSTLLWPLQLASDQIKINFNNNKMLVSGDLKDADNDTIAQIVNNTWDAVNPQYKLSFWDRNYNTYAFEIIRSDGVPMLQVAMIGNNKIQIGGIFYSPKFGIIDIAPASQADMKKGIGASINVNLNDSTIEAENIPTLFKYPCLNPPTP